MFECTNINPYPANMKNMVAPTNTSKWQMGFKSVFKGLNKLGNLMLQRCLCTGNNRIILKGQNLRYDIHDNLAVQ
jgi:hypothetical protein